jgi:hypothetical protein
VLFYFVTPGYILYLLAYARVFIYYLDNLESGEEYLGLYDIKERRLYDLNDSITILPENVVGLEIPHEVKLDPVGVECEFGVDISQFFQQNPITTDLKTLIRPIIETCLPEMVEENLRKAKNQNIEQNLGRKMGR